MQSAKIVTSLHAQRSGQSTDKFQDVVKIILFATLNVITMYLADSLAHSCSFSKTVLALAFTIWGILPSQAQSLNENWEEDLATSMSQFMDCANTSPDKSQCSSFIGESLAKVYKVNAFYSDKLKRHLHIYEISKSMIDGGQWTLLGHAYEQKALNEAQQCANTSKAVIAVYTTASGGKHIALILPGKLEYSGSWGFNVPNSASFFFDNPAKSYVAKGLSYAFSKNMIKDIALYCRKY
jgi:hypothetical protein